MLKNIALSRTLCATGVTLAALFIAGCGRDAAPLAHEVAVPAAEVEAARLVVHENPHCGCCALWGQAMERAGFLVEVRKTEHLGEVKAALGVPPGLGSCHTAEIGGYFVEGHVPAREIWRLLEERPRARGLSVPGMPLGSPGMEVPDGRVQSYQVLLVAEDGSTMVYARYPE
jgi:hypothetical protein